MVLISFAMRLKEEANRLPCITKSKQTSLHYINRS